jgi:Mor family transcriptional regulator
MDQIKTVSGQRISFFEMIPQNELQKYFRQGLSYVVNILSSHYDSLIKFRYYTHEIVLACELMI